MTDAVIASAVRTAAGKAPKGTLCTTRPDEMAAVVIEEALRRAKGIDPAEVDDVILGCAMPEAEQGMNVARIASLRAGIPVDASAVTINRFCSSGLQAIAFAAERIMCGSAETIVAGGTESMSLVPMGGHKIAPNPELVKHYPNVYLSTGLVAENHARESQISREAQDEFAFRSHTRALAAIDGGRCRAPILVQFKTHCAGHELFFERVRQAGIALTHKAEVNWQGVGGLQHALNVPGARRAGSGIGARSRTGAATEHSCNAGHQGILDLLWTNEMYMRVDPASRNDLAFAGNDFGTWADDNLNVGLNIGVAGFTDGSDTAAFNSNIGFDDAPVINDKRVGDDEIHRDVVHGDQPVGFKQFGEDLGYRRFHMVSES